MSNFDSEEAIIALVKRFAKGSEAKVFDNDFVPQIAFYTEDEPEAPRVIFFPQMVDEESRNPISYATHVLASGLDNLAGIAFIHDGYKATQQAKADGSPWGPGDMQHALTNQTVDAHLVSESLFYTVITKDVAHMAGLPYDRTADSIEFRWDELQYMSTKQDGIQSAGFYPDMLRHALGAPKVMEEMVKQFGSDTFGLDQADARMHTLSICTKMVLIHTQMLCVIPCRSKQEQALLQRSMKEGPFSELLQSFDQDDIDEIVTLEQAFEAPAFGEE